MTEELSSIVCALKQEGAESMTENLLFNLMIQHENIHQMVLEKCGSIRKAKLIRKEMLKIATDKRKKEEITPKEKLKFSIAEKKREREKGLPKKNNGRSIHYRFDIRSKILVLKLRRKNSRVCPPF